MRTLPRSTCSIIAYIRYKAQAGTKKKSHFFFVLFFQHRPRFDIMPDIGIIATSPNKNGPRVDIVREVRHNYNHKSPKKSRKKTTSRPARPAPDPAPPRRFLQCGRTTQTRPKSTAETPPKTTAKTTPKTTPETYPKQPPKNTPPEPLQILGGQPRAATPKPAPRFTGSELGPPWVRTGSAPHSLETLPHTATLSKSPRHIPT